MSEELVCEQTLREQLSKKIEGNTNLNNAMKSKVSMIEGKLSEAEKECAKMKEMCNTGVDKVRISICCT